MDSGIGWGLVNAIVRWQSEAVQDAVVAGSPDVPEMPELTATPPSPEGRFGGAVKISLEMMNAAKLLPPPPKPLTLLKPLPPLRRCRRRTQSAAASFLQPPAMEPLLALGALVGAKSPDGYGQEYG